RRLPGGRRLRPGDAGHRGPLPAPPLRDRPVREVPALTRRLVLAALVVLLAVLDLARPYLGPALRPWQAGAALVTLAALWTVLRQRGAGFRDALPWLALAACLIPTYLDHSRNVESDGIHYYSYLRSILFDGDLDLRNDYELLGWPNPALRNPLPVGAPILWSPLVLLVHAGCEAGRLSGASAPNGVEPVYQGAACLAT